MNGMRIGTLGLFALASAGLFACSSGTTPSGSLSFQVAESLLVLDPNDPAYAYALLSNGTGNCAALQAGVQLEQIGGTNYNYLDVDFISVDAAGDYAAVTAGSYSMIDPNTGTTPSFPALFGYSSVVSSDPSCNPSGDNAQSGTVTLSPFNSADGGLSTMSYSAVYDGTQLSGTSTLPTCLIDSTLDAGATTCIQCVPVADGGVCAVE